MLVVAADHCTGYGRQNGDKVDIFPDKAVAPGIPNIIVGDLSGESYHENRGADAALTNIAANVEPGLLARQRMVEQDQRKSMLFEQTDRIVVIAGKFDFELRQTVTDQVRKPLVVFDAKDQSVSSLGVHIITVEFLLLDSKKLGREVNQTLRINIILVGMIS